jgi:methyl-accepting chemotaxis protein
MSNPSASEKRSFAVFSNMPIKAKLVSGFAVVVAILAVVGAVSYTTFADVADEFATYRASAHLLDEGRVLGGEFEQLTADALAFARAEDAERAANVETLKEAFVETLAEAKAGASSAEETEQLATIEADFAAFWASLEQVTERHAEAVTTTATVLRPTGDELALALGALAEDAAKAGDSNALVLANAALQAVMEARLAVAWKLPEAELEPLLVEAEAALAALVKTTAASPLADAAEQAHESAAAWGETALEIATVNHETLALVEGELEQRHQALANAITAIEQNAVNQEETIGQAAEHQLAASETLILVMVLAGVAFGLALGWFIGNAVARPIASATLVVEKLAGGDDKVEVVVTDRRDEIGRLWRAMADLKQTVADAFRLRTMVDEMPINVMMADPKNDFKVVYINKTSVNTLRGVEQYMPVKADQVLGSSVDIFHKNPSHQRRILGDPANLPWASKIKLGPEILDLRVSAIRDKVGAYIGPMVSWTVVTKQVKMIDDFEANVKAVVDTVASASTELQSNAQSMSATAEETNRQSSAVAAASEQATANVQTVASAAEELASSVAEIGRQVSQSASIAAMAVDEAKRTDATVQGLSEAAQKIGEVVRLISDIASQTNLLALNATIEAARAGEAGKGFAVVASEVKSLANQTAKATEEIAAQIGAIQSSTNDAVGAIQSIGKTIGEINDIASSISAAVEEQGAATREIARNVQEASQGTTEVSSNIAGVTQAAGETGSAASQVLSAAGELSSQAERLKAEVESFLTTVRAA